MKAELTFTTELDQNECPDSYCLTGTVIDNDGYEVAVGEYTTKFDKAWNTLMFYTQNFKNVTVTFKTKVEAS